MRRVVIVGSTGSIGTQALDVVERSDELEVVGLGAGSSVDALLSQARQHGVRRLALADEHAAARAAELAGVTPEQVLASPTWEIGGEITPPTWETGGKITIDSATLMNKGLEVIEARHLFGVPLERIDVVVHPQSIVHGLVHLNDGSSLAHLGYPDMRVPISYAMHYPDRADVPVPSLDLVELGSLTFEVPDLETFRCLSLARAAAHTGGTAPCVLNAANEVAVKAFLDGAIPFLGIPHVIEQTLEAQDVRPVGHFSDLYAADADARRLAAEAIEGVTA